MRDSDLDWKIEKATQLFARPVRQNFQKIFRRNRINPAIATLNDSVSLSPGKQYKQSARSFVTDSVKSPRVLHFATTSDFQASPMKIALDSDKRARPRELCGFATSKRTAAREQAPTPQLGLGAGGGLLLGGGAKRELRIDLRKAR